MIRYIQSCQMVLIESFRLLASNMTDFAGDRVAQKEIKPHFLLVRKTIAWTLDLDEHDTVRHKKSEQLVMAIAETANPVMI